MSEYEVVAHTKVHVDSDLTEFSLENAITTGIQQHKDKFEKHYGAAGVPRLLIAPVSLSFVAGKLCQKYDLDYISVPDELMKEDSWMIVGKFNGVYSPGA